MKIKDSKESEIVAAIKAGYRVSVSTSPDHCCDNSTAVNDWPDFFESRTYRNSEWYFVIDGTFWKEGDDDDDE